MAEIRKILTIFAIGNLIKNYVIKLFRRHFLLFRRALRRIFCFLLLLKAQRRFTLSLELFLLTMVILRKKLAVIGKTFIELMPNKVDV